MAFTDNLLKIFLIFLMLSVLTACTSLPENYTYRGDISKSQLIDGVSFLGKSIAKKDLPSVDIMMITPEMEAFLELNTGKLNMPYQKAVALGNSIVNEDKLGLIYEPGITYTARQTFENRQGNCLAFSLLYSSLARKLGLEVNFQEVNVLPEWDLSDDEIYVENRHVNVRVKLPGSTDLVVDISRIAVEQELSHTFLDENTVSALYYGNIAAENLLKKQYEQSFLNIVKAIKTDSNVPSLWVNLGVLYRRAGNNEFAEKAYFTALEFDGKNQAALNNLAHLYNETGDREKAEYFLSLVKSYQDKNPYVHFVKAEKALEKENLDEAMWHIDDAIKRKSDDPRFYRLKSKIYQLLGDENNATKTMHLADEITRNQI
ncbi:MAG: tetratricopeptide repeat protein [Kordiimonadaceae bacterium]|nr:tetratricopeptide repeat protein [Kordiimonadaceae bacterium]